MTGSYERVLASPLSRPSLIVGRSVKEMLPLVAQAALITVIAIPFGFTLYPAHAVVGLLLLGVFGIGLGALSYSLALKTRSNEWVFWAVQQSLIFPLLILSGMMLPLEDGPQWLQTASNSIRSPTSSKPSASCSTARSAPTRCGVPSRRR